MLRSLILCARSIGVCALPALTLAGLACSPASAQLPTHVHYPQAATDGAWVNYAPMGTLAGNQLVEARTQILVPATHLPSTGGWILGLGVVAEAAYSLTFQRLDLTLAETSSASLAATFDANLAVAPQQVLSLQPGTSLSFSGRVWTSIPLAQPYYYSGSGSLVVEFRKSVVATGATRALVVAAEPRRWDLPRQITAMGLLGSGAMDASTATGNAEPISLQLEFLGASCISLGSGRGGNYGLVFAVGQTVTLAIEAVPGDLHVSAIDAGGLGFQRPGLVVPGIAGRFYLDVVSPLLLVLGSGLLDQAGASTLSFVLPNDPSLVARHLCFQSLVVHADGAMEWTSATDAFVNW